jgi:hypothetical protein
MQKGIPMERKLVFGFEGLVVQLTGPIILVQFNDMGHVLPDVEAIAAQIDKPPTETRDVTHELGSEFAIVLWELGRRLQQQAAAVLRDGSASPSQH